MAIPDCTNIDNQDRGWTACLGAIWHWNEYTSSERNGKPRSERQPGDFTVKATKPTMEEVCCTGTDYFAGGRKEKEWSCEQRDD